MEEDNSFLDTPQDDVIIREIQMMDSPKSFSRNLIPCFGIRQITAAETAHLQTNNNKMCYA